MTPLRQRLREATSDAHERVDQAFGGYDLASRAGYRAFLERHARAVLPSEAALERAGVIDLLTDWAERRRGDALRHDLTVMGGTAPGPAHVPALLDAATMWGALYVLEGSRLGARVLLRQVMTSGDATVRRATAYLGHGMGKPLWPRFVVAMEAAIPAQQAPERVIAGALATFAAFEDMVMEVASD